tara:strand:- start:111 stop:437 length:327 start_codon:yes stop_codon:yes gene_type:complete
MLSNKIIIAAMAIPLLTACSKSLVKVEPGSESVTVANSINQDSCTLKAQAKVRMTGYAERRNDYTEQDDIQLAKNAAVDQGGNTIYRLDHPEDGKGTQSAVYQIYNCS